MNIREAQKKALWKMAGGALIGILSLISTIMSLLLMLYYHTADGTRLGNAIALQVKRLISFCYEHTSALHWLWDLAPIPDIRNPMSKESLVFAVVYLGVFVGAALFGSGSQLRARIKRIKLEIEDQVIKDSIAGTVRRSRRQIEDDVEIPSSSIWNQWHTLYLAPLVVTILGALILKFVFGI